MIEIEILQEDIDLGEKCMPCSCPIANAIKRKLELEELGLFGVTYIGRNPVFMSIDSLSVNFKIEPMEDVREFMIDFDNGRKVYPGHQFYIDASLEDVMGEFNG